MKKCLLVNAILIVFLIAFLPFVYRYFVLQIRTFDMATLQTETYVDPFVTSLPITSSHGAAQYAVHSGKYELSEEYPESNNWLVRTETVYNLYQIGNTWRVTVSSTYMPRYFCIMEFTSNGEWILENSCHQNGK